MSKENQIQEEIDLNDSEVNTSNDFEDLIIKRHLKDKMDEETWSKVKIEDVQIHSGIEYAERNRLDEQSSSNDDVLVKGAITGEDSIKDIIDNVEQESLDSYTTKVKAFKDPDGRIFHNGKRYLYRERQYIFVTVSSKDELYSNKFLLTRRPQFKDDKLEDIYKDIVQDIGDSGSIGSPPDRKTRYLRTDKTLSGSRSGMITRSLIRTMLTGSVVTTGFFGSMAMVAATGSVLIGFMALFTSIMVASTMLRGFYDGWYEVTEVDWTDEFPDDSKITSDVTRNIDMDESFLSDIKDRNFKRKNASVTANEDGSLRLETDEARWTFEYEREGLPSEDVSNLYQKYGGIDFSRTEEIPIKVSRFDDSTLVGNECYVSDNNKKIMKPDGI